MNEKGGFVYIMASQRNGTLYIGVTSQLTTRIWQHRNGVGSQFASKNKCKILVWFEPHETIEAARARELQMKKWKRAWKLNAIEGLNPDWDDLFEKIAW